MASKYPEDQLSVQEELGDTSMDQQLHAQESHASLDDTTAQLKSGLNITQSQRKDEKERYCDVYLVYADEDEAKMEWFRNQLESIELDCGRNITTKSKNDYTPGYDICEEHEKFVINANHVFVMVTTNFKSSRWANHWKSETLCLNNEYKGGLLVPVYMEKVESYKPPGTWSKSPINLYALQKTENGNLTTDAKVTLKDIVERRTWLWFKPDDAESYVREQYIREEGMHCELKKGGGKRNLSSMLKKYLCAFLNSSGGILYFGVTDDGKVQGVPMDRKIKDQFRTSITNCIHSFTPRVSTTMYQVDLVPVYDPQDNEVAKKEEKRVSDKIKEGGRSSEQHTEQEGSPPGEPQTRFVVRITIAEGVVKLKPYSANEKFYIRAESTVHAVVDMHERYFYTSSPIINKMASQNAGFMEN